MFRKLLLVPIILLGLCAFAWADTTERFIYDSDSEGFDVQESDEMTLDKSEASYWTMERMLNAKPATIELDESSREINDFLDDDLLYRKGESEKGQSAAGEKEVSRLLLGLEDTVALSGIQVLAYPPPHSTFFVPFANYGLHPYRTVGKVFFTQGGSNYVCSGSSAGRRAVLTAGHCLSNGSGSWHTNWRFVPAYRAGLAPYGTWSAFFKITFSAWHNSYNLCRDVGFAAVRDISGLTLSQRVGALGFAWNWGYNQFFNMFGYPAASPYNGLYMVQTAAQFSRADNPNGCTPATVGIGTNQTGGTSGGPRLILFNPNSIYGNYANGVNSYIYTARPLELFSPYFDTAVYNMRSIAIAQ